MEPYFADEVNPTPDEVRRWAYSGALAPMEDFEIVVADPEMLPTLLDLVGDQACPKRSYLLGSLYCLVGHARPLDDPRLVQAADQAVSSQDPWLRTWGRRTQAVIADPGSRDRSDWCDWRGLRTRPVEDD